jgi:hypothetical protein
METFQNLEESASIHPEGQITGLPGSGQLKNELQKGWQKAIAESKSALWELGNSLVVDARAFWNIFKTVSVWFLKPLSINPLNQLVKNAKHLCDYQLVKALFLLLILWLVIEPVADPYGIIAEEATGTDVWVHQFVYFLIYTFSLGVFLAIGWLWQFFFRPSVPDQRIFTGFLFYEFATVFFIQGVSVAVLHLRLTEGDDLSWGMLFTFLIPFLHIAWFFAKMGAYYNLSPIRRRYSLLFAVVIAFLYVIIPAAANEVTLGTGTAVHTQVE